MGFKHIQRRELEVGEFVPYVYALQLLGDLGGDGIVRDHGEACALVFPAFLDGRLGLRNGRRFRNTRLWSRLRFHRALHRRNAHRLRFRNRQGLFLIGIALEELPEDIGKPGAYEEQPSAKQKKHQHGRKRLAYEIVGPSGEEGAQLASEACAKGSVSAYEAGDAGEYKRTDERSAQDHQGGLEQRLLPLVKQQPYGKREQED